MVVASVDNSPRGSAKPEVELNSNGFSLIEVMVAAVIAVIAVLGLAHSFSVGRGLIDRFATARDALAAAEERLERLGILSLQDPTHADLAAGVHGPFARPLNVAPMNGQETWTVVWVDDPLDNPDPDPNDYKRVTVVIAWTQGSIQDQITLARVLP